MSSRCPGKGRRDRNPAQKPGKRGPKVSHDPPKGKEEASVHEAVPAVVGVSWKDVIAPLMTELQDLRAEVGRLREQVASQGDSDGSESGEVSETPLEAAKRKLKLSEDLAEAERIEEQLRPIPDVEWSNRWVVTWRHAFLLWVLLLLVTCEERLHELPWWGLYVVVSALACVAWWAGWVRAPRLNLSTVAHYVNKVARRRGVDVELLSYLYGETALQGKTKAHIRETKLKAISWIKQHRRGWGPAQQLEQSVRAVVAATEFNPVERVMLDAFGDASEGMFNVHRWVTEGVLPGGGRTPTA